MGYARSAADGNSLDSFIKHRGSLGGGSKFLKGWTEKGKLYAWLHCLQLPIGLWRHQMPMLVVKEDKDTRKVERHVWSQSLNCHETEEVLLRQNFRDKDTGEREVPPTRCPFCRFIEWVYQEVRAGRLDWTDAILKIEGADNPKENTVINAAGIYNGFADYNNKMSDEQKADLKRAGIYQSEAWKQNGKARLSYVFTIVNNDDIAAGVQVTIEGQSLGDKVKSVINDRLESAGVEAGNPQINPYCIEFTYDEKAKFDEKYHARYIERIKLTNEIEQLLRSDPPDLSRVLEPYNMKSFRAHLEKCLVIDAPLDDIFDVEVDEQSESGDDEFPHGANAPDGEPEEEEKKAPPPPKSAPAPKAEAKSEKKGGRRIKKEEPKAPEIPPEELGDPCDNCAAPMRKTDTKCVACGQEYEDDADDAAPAVDTAPCKHCKHEFPKTEKVCPKCNKKRLPF